MKKLISNNPKGMNLIVIQKDSWDLLHGVENNRTLNKGSSIWFKTESGSWLGCYKLDDCSFLEISTLLLLKNDFGFDGIRLEDCSVDTKYVDKKLKEMGLIKVEKFELWKPEKEEQYFCLYSAGELWEDTNNGRSLDLERFAIGNCFKTKDSIEAAKNKLLATETIKRWTTRENKGWSPNWEDRNERKHVILVYEGSLDWNHHSIIRVLPDNFMYVRTKEIARKMMEELEEELKIYWGID